MAIQEFTQPPVGVRRELQVSELEQVVTILRIVEQLPLLSRTDGDESLQDVLKQIQVIEQNHRELSQWARSLLSETENRQLREVGSG